MTKRGTSNTNARGSAASRRIRKRWLLEQFGDGETCVCSTCPVVLTFDTLTVDRYPVPGVDGGTYRRGNIRPQCAGCASKQGGEMSQARRRIAAVLTAVTVLSTTACGGSTPPAQADDHVPGDRYVHWVDIGAGNRVLCITAFTRAAGAIAMSCDWARMERR